MPWDVKQDGRCPAAKPWGVVKQMDDSLEGCHPTEAAAHQQQAALYASEASAMTDEQPTRAEWDAAYINDLSDSAFACIDDGGEKDDDGRTTPRSLRHYPHHNAAGELDLPHLRNALSRVAQEGTTSCGHDHLMMHGKAEGMMEAPRDTAEFRPPRDNLVRAQPGDFELRDGEDGAMPTMVGHFARFGEWAEIDSVFEGHFMERLAPGAFRKTFAENRDRIRVTFQHGKDPQLGHKVLGPVAVLEEDDYGARYEVPLLDTAYNRELLPGLRAGLYGSSFRFNAVKEDFVRRPARSAYNPQGLPERTLREVVVPEFGPVTYPAYAGATAGIRSLTDAYVFDAFTRDPERLAQIIESMRNPALPSDGAEAEPHSDEGSRSDPPDDPPPIAAVPATTGPAPAGPSDSKEQTVATEYATREEKVSRITDIKAELSSIAVEYPGVLPADVQATWDALEKEQPELERDVAAWDYRQARIKANAENERNVETVGIPIPNFISRRTDTEISDIGEIRSKSRSEEEFHQGLRDNAMRSVERAKFPHPNADQAGAQTHIASLLDYKDSPDKELAQRILTTGTPLYKRTFNKLISGVQLSPEEQRAAALAVTGTTTTGGFAVPYVFDPTIIAIGAHTSVMPYRVACRNETIVGGNNWRAVTATAVVAAYQSEAAAEGEQGPTFGQPTFTVQRASAFATVSYETLQDRPDIGAELSVLFQEAKDTLEEAQFTTGVGTTVYPEGMFLDGAFTAIETVTNNVYAIADVYALESGLPSRHRAGAAWFFNRSVIHTTQGFESVNGILFGGTNYAAVGTIATNPGGNTGLRLLGYPVWEVPSASALITTSAAIIGVFCDPKKYVIVDRAGMNVEIIPHMLNGATPSFPTGQRGVFAIWRNTARVLDVGAGRQIKVNAP